jgi:hypothetical protein
VIDARPIATIHRDGLDKRPSRFTINGWRAVRGIAASDAGRIDPMQWCARRARGALAGLLLCLLWAHASADTGPVPPGAEVQALLQTVVATRDHAGRPFAVVDKKGARLHVFDGAARLIASTPVLLGAALGDHAVPGVGARPTATIAPHERTTPAGRFVSEPGRNLDGEHVVWFDYDAGLAIHRLRPGASYALRSARLASGQVDHRRVSLGCVVVPGAFYDGVVRPLLGRSRGTVYVLPESGPAQAWFNAVQAS